MKRYRKQLMHYSQSTSLLMIDLAYAQDSSKFLDLNMLTE